MAALAFQLESAIAALDGLRRAAASVEKEIGFRVSGIGEWLVSYASDHILKYHDDAEEFGWPTAEEVDALLRYARRSREK